MGELGGVGVSGLIGERVRGFVLDLGMKLVIIRWNRIWYDQCIMAPS